MVSVIRTTTKHYTNDNNHENEKLMVDNQQKKLLCKEDQNASVHLSSRGIESTTLYKKHKMLPILHTLIPSSYS